jgi:streptomycin 6-kinase
MKKLKRQVVSAFGEKGQEWIDRLPKVIKSCSERWQLCDLVPFDNLSWNFVAKGTQIDHPVVLKISCSIDSLEREVNALKAFSKESSVEVISYDAYLGAVLLEAATPGEELLSQTKHESEMITICCKIADRIRQAQKPSNYPFEKIRDQLANLDKDWSEIPSELVQTARKIKSKLLPNMLETHIIHGDLHRQNILSHGTSWKVIDPKGYLGSLYNEVWPFIYEPKIEIPVAAKNLNLNQEMLFQWCYIHSILSATWCLEDEIDPTNILGLAKKIFLLLK